MAWMGAVEIIDSSGTTRIVGVPNFDSLNGRRIWHSWMQRLFQSPVNRVSLDELYKVDHLISECPEGYELGSGDAVVEKNLQVLAKLVATIEDELGIKIIDFLHAHPDSWRRIEDDLRTKGWMA